MKAGPRRPKDQDSDPSPGGLDRRSELRAADTQNRMGWYLASAAVLFMVGLAIWMHRLLESQPETSPDGGIVMVDPDPDAGLKPAPAVAVAFGAERCVPWHVSAAEAPPARGLRYLILTSRIVDPYGYTLAGFSEDCGADHQVLVVEDLAPGELPKLVEKIKPAALIGVGQPAIKRWQAEAETLPLLYAMVQAPKDSGLLRPGAYGVLPWVPMGPFVHHALKVLPDSRRPLVVLHPPGPFAALASEVAGFLTAGVAKSKVLSIDENRADEVLARAAQAGKAWLVLPDRQVIDHRLYNRIQIAAEQAQIPVCVPDEEHVRAGAYAGVGPDSHRIGQQLCHLAGALSRGSLPQAGQVYCPEYSFAAVHQATVEKLGYILDPGQLSQAKLYKWH
jgi:ABC-type uncharacterized transport system substrate-binding protein